MIKRKVFVSYDVEKDEKLKEVFLKILERADSPFEVVGHSVKLTEPVNNWEYNTGKVVMKAEIILVLLGPTTHKAPGVKKELEAAFDEEIPSIQIVGYKNVTLKPVPGAGQMIQWSWEQLKKMV